MGRVSQALGCWGEDLAVDHLEAAGLRVLDRRWRCREGELDIVAREGSTVVVVEVKTRSGVAFGWPVEGVTAAKLSRLRRLAARWLAEHDERPDEVRVDVVGVLRGRDGVSVEHLVGVG